MPKDDKCVSKYCHKEPTVKVHDVKGDSGYWLCERHAEERLNMLYMSALKRLGVCK